MTRTMASPSSLVARARVRAAAARITQTRDKAHPTCSRQVARQRADYAPGRAIRADRSLAVAGPLLRRFARTLRAVVCALRFEVGRMLWLCDRRDRGWIHF